MKRRKGDKNPLAIANIGNDTFQNIQMPQEEDRHGY